MTDYVTRKPIRYCGIIPPMVTPLDGDGALDVPGLETLIEHIIRGGVNGLFILGTTGEAPSLCEAVQNELIQRTCRQVDGRVPVLVGITNTCFETSIKTARTAQQNDANAVVLSTPYYFGLSQQDLVAYTKKLLGKIELPVFLYNIPSCTKVWFELSTLHELMNCPQIIGLKDSSADMIYLQQAYQLAALHRPDWSVLIGPEELLAEAVLKGINGGVSGGANLFPQLYVELYQAALERRTDRIQSLQNIVLEVSGSIYAIEKGGYLKALKCALACMGICGETPAQPTQCLPMHLKNHIYQKLEKDILPAMQELLPIAKTKRVILPVENHNSIPMKNKVGT
jgi:dihydrodipicolinate synthase/N-acetylneuraminate lyase